jgi:hypothetical protein
MWRFLQISGRILWQCVGLVIMLHVLGATGNRNISLIIAVGGLTYSTILAIIQLVAVYNLKSHQLELLWDRRGAVRLDADAAIRRFTADYAVSGVYIGALYLICLFHVFSRL